MCVFCWSFKSGVFSSRFFCSGNSDVVENFVPAVFFERKSVLNKGRKFVRFLFFTRSLENCFSTEKVGAENSQVLLFCQHLKKHTTKTRF